MKPPDEEPEDRLAVSLFTFGYRRSGLPDTGSAHGGGFVFDCRCLPNPGQEERFARESGLDQEVVKWLKKRPEVRQFVEAVTGIVRLSADAYLSRGYSELCVCLGCTGGQHRSVFVAEQLAAQLRAVPGVSVSVLHTERGLWAGGSGPEE